MVAAALIQGRGWAYPVAAVVAGFNAGRVSRSVVDPTGSPGPLALEHLPLLALVLAVAFLAAAGWLVSCRRERVA